MRFIATILLLSAPALLEAQTLSPEQLQEDFRTFRGAIEQGHPGIYRYTPKPEMDRIFDAAASRLKQPMTAMELYRVLAPVAGAIKCGHTKLDPPLAFQQRIFDVPLFPFDVRVGGGKVYVVRDHTGARRLTGAEIRSVNGVPISRILDTMLAARRGDGDSATAGPWIIGHNHVFAGELYALMGIEGPFNIEYSLNGETSQATLAGLPPRQYPPEWRPPVSANYRLLNDGAVGFLQITSFSGQAIFGPRAKPLKGFFEDVFKDLAEKKVANLIVDLRDTRVGDGALGEELLSYLLAEPFPYYRDLLFNNLTADFFKYGSNPEKMQAYFSSTTRKGDDGRYHLTGNPNLGTQKPAEPNYGGKVFALMNGGSFKVACEFLSMLHQARRATFIGEETGGGYYGNTSGPSIAATLPNSKLVLPVYLTGYYMAIDGAGHGSRGIMPDHPVEFSIDDLLAGKDKPMEMALRLASGSPAPLAAAQPPYPPSKVVEKIEWKPETHFQHGPGADQWPLTWADDDNLYSGWGDGWGWNKTGPKRSIGVTRISGMPPTLRGEDLWGAGPGSGFGKPEALIAVDRSLYMFWTVGRSKDDKANTATAVSTDHGAHWSLSEKKAFPQVPDGFRVRGIAQFGKGYRGARDEFVYVYFGFSRADDLYLARAPKDRIFDASRYEWFAGVENGKPAWGSDFERKRPAFTDPNGYIWHVGVSFVPGIGRFVLTKPHNAPGADRSLPEGDRAKVAGLGVFDAPDPWGPWTTVYYQDRFYDEHFKFTYFIPNKYVDPAGKSFWLVWSGPPEYDNVNFVRGEFRLR